MTARITKLLLLFSGLLLSLSLAAQYPNNPIKSRLGWQTTGDGLVYRGSGAPAYSPGTLFNAWMYLDTTNYALYMYRNFQWTKLPLVNNGLTLDGSYVQLGGTLVENTTVERSTYTLDFGKISGSNNGYLSFYGTDPHYVGILTTKDGTESGLTMGNKLFGFEVDDSDHTFQLNGTRFGFDATYLGTLGVSQFKMDSTRFYIRGLPTYATHAAADADIDSYGMYQITNGRAIYSRTGTADKVSPNLFDNNTYAGVISKPWKFGEFTTAGTPSGTNNYWVWDTDQAWVKAYRNSAYIWPLQSVVTGGRGTSTYIPYFDANGQITQSPSIRWDQSISELFVDGSFRPSNLQATSTVNIHNIGGLRFAQNTNPGGVGFRNDIGSGNWYFAGNGNAVATGTFIWEVVNNGSMGPTNNGKFHQYRGKFHSGNGPSAGATWKYMSIEPEYNFTTTNAFTIYGWDYGPVLTGLTSANVTHNAVRVQTGNVLLNTISGKTGIGVAFTPSEELDINGDTRVRDSLLISNLPNQTSATKILSADGTGWVGYRAFSDFASTTLYSGNGTIGGSRIATLTDSLRFQFGGSDIFKLKSNGVVTVGMPTETNSFVITNTGSENYNNYRGNVFMVGTTSNGDTTTGTRRNNHEASYFSGVNLVEGGDNVYYDAVSGYGNVVRGQNPKNIVYGVFNTVIGSDNGAYGYGNVINASNVTIFGRDNSVSGSNSNINGRGNSVTQSNAFIYGNLIGSTNLSLHGFGTVTPRKRMDINGDVIVGDTLYNTFPATHATNDGMAVWKSTALGYALGKVEMKRDTTIYVTDADYNFAAAITSAQVLARHNRIIIYSKLSSGATSDNQIILHSASSNFLQCEIIIYSNDASADADATSIDFTTNGAVDGAGGTTSSSTMTPGQRVNIRAVNDGGYKWFYN